MQNHKGRVMGIDPGSQFLGYGLLEESSGELTYIDHGVLVAPKEKFAHRLFYLGEALDLIFKTYQPHVVAVEQAFLARNVDSAFKLGHMRGVIFYLAQKWGAEVAEYAPRQVKKSVTGYGAADKEQVAKVLEMLLGLRSVDILSKGFDACDALALAFHHSQAMSVQRKLDSMGEL